MHVNEEYGLTAPPEVVFDVLTDVDRATRWLPGGVSVEQSGPNRVLVRAGGYRQEYEFARAPDELRLAVRFAGASQPSAVAAVSDGSAGGSRLLVEVTTPDGGPSEERVRQLLAELVRRLQRDVSDNFNAG